MTPSPNVTHTLDAVPWLTGEQMIEVDRAMVEDYGIKLIQMMEHAGRHLAHLARERFLAGQARGHTVVVLAGRGGNGGGALVCARRLAAWGASVRVLVTAEAAHFEGVPRHQLQILTHMGLEVLHEGAPPREAPDLIIDGIIGYSLRGAPRGRAAELIRWANQSPAPVLALDVPSGLDSTTGEATETVIRAAATMTLALPKVGLRAGMEAGLVGELYLADISVPPQLYRAPSLGVVVPDLFDRSDLVRLL